MVFQTFRAADEGNTGGDPGGGEIAGDALEELGGGHDDDDVALRGDGQVRRGFDIFREGDAGEEFAVGMRGVDFLRLGGVMRPEGDRPAMTGK